MTAVGEHLRHTRAGEDLNDSATKNVGNDSWKTTMHCTGKADQVFFCSLPRSCTMPVSSLEQQKQIQTRTPAIAVSILLRSAASELMMADWIETRTPTIPVTVSTFEVCDIKNGDTILAVVSPMWALPNHYGSSLKTPKCKVQIINEVYKRAPEKMPYVHVNTHWRF